MGQQGLNKPSPSLHLSFKSIYLMNHQDQPDNAALAEQVLQKNRILIVEDELILAEDISLQLEALGYQTTALVSHPQDLEPHLQASDFDLALLDIELHGAHQGLEIAKRLKNQYRLPFIFLTSHTENEILEQAKKTLPYGYLTKPVRPRELKSTIEVAMYRWAYEQSLGREKEKKLLLGINSAIARIRDRDQLLEVIFQNIQPLFPCDDACLFVLDQEKKQAHFLLGHRVIDSAIRNEVFGQDFALEGSPMEAIIAAEQPLLSTMDMLQDLYPDFPHFQVLAEAGVRQFIAGSLRSGGEVIGILIFGAKRENAYAEADYPFFQAISDQLATALSNVMANEALRQKEQAKDLEVALINELNISQAWPQKLTRLSQVLAQPFPHHLLLLALPSLPETSFYLCEKISHDENRLLDYRDLAALLQVPEKNLKEKQFLPAHLLENPEIHSFDPEKLPASPSQFQLFLDKFHIRSICALPFTLEQDEPGLIAFLSRQPQAFKLGHLDLLQKLQSSLVLALEKQLAFQKIENLNAQLAQEKNYLQEEINFNYGFENMIGHSTFMKFLYQRIKEVARGTTTVLIQGETGTGKELVARALHQQSPRRDKPLIKVNCAALPEQLIESELFGHEKGAFTGAIQARVGKFELAHEGTIFLDEIGELPLVLQAKLLRVLQEKEFERLGSNRLQRSDFRLIAATNRNLELSVKEKTFRADLYYRLNTFPIYVKPLREHPEDIEALAQHFGQKFSQNLGYPFSGFSPGTLEKMQTYPWPGNVRELQNTIEQAVVLAQGKPLVFKPLSAYATPEEPSLPPAFSLPLEELTADQIKKEQEDLERHYLLQILEKTKWRIRGRKGAAAWLQLKPTTLESRMQKLGIER